jgi:hypothetical protein
MADFSWVENVESLDGSSMTDCRGLEDQAISSSFGEWVIPKFIGSWGLSKLTLRVLLSSS